MTTAHRPTFDPARGKEAARGEAYHQRLLPAHKTLKFRQATQGAPDEQARRDLRAELLRSEAKYYAQKEGRALPEDDGDDEKYGQGDETASRKPVAAIEEGGVAGENGGLKRKLSDRSKAEAGDDPGGMVDGEGEEDYEAKKRRVLEETRAIDAESESSESSEESDDDDDDDDEEEESDDEFEKLNKELAKIKAERAAAAAKQAEEKAKRDEEQREKDIALGNPLLNAEQGRGDYGVKRRWDDDVVFKNQARGTEERGKDKRFVNDLLRSDFHRRFMDKYIR